MSHQFGKYFCLLSLGQSSGFSRSLSAQSYLRKMFYEELEQRGSQSRCNIYNITKEIYTFYFSPTGFGSIAPYSAPFQDIDPRSHTNSPYTAVTMEIVHPQAIEDVDTPEDINGISRRSNENPVTLR